MKEIAFVFLKLGTIAFGGPAAHIAMMEEEIVRRKNWLSHEHFLDLLGATNLIPGPNSTEMAIHIGYLRAGWRGLIVAGVCFIVPAVLITLFFAHLYVEYGSTPQLGSLVFGIRSAIIAIIAAAVIRLGKPILKNRFMIVLSAVVAILNLVGVDEILLLFSAGAIGLLWNYRNRIQELFLLPLLSGTLAVQSLPANGAATGASLTGLGLFFLKIGSILYGSGYVLVAFLQGGLVEARQWLTQAQLLDAVAAGQFTPGPVLSTATFIGYVILGLPGAVVATTGIFLPSFILVLIISPFIPRLRKSQLMRGFLDGVNAASLGLMLAVAIMLAAVSLVSASSWTIFLVAGFVILIWKINAAWIVSGSAFFGWFFSQL
ncbi:MAG: chromate efflux transporter [Bacteroidetes bacterium]|nr:chromate efflux transporter [Bacteroidota bacterium]MCW5896074.1 chromate efflux transporter [Bacteroidota bacterium]